MDRQQALDLLNNNHAFPGPYDLRIVVKGGAGEGTLKKLRAQLVRPDRLVSVSEKPSRTGKYTSLRVSAHFGSAEGVLDMYAFLQGLDEVLTSL